MTAYVMHRRTCRLCESPNVQLVLKLEPIPLSENYAWDVETARRVPRYPVDLYMCTACGHVQQLDVVDAKSLWENYTYYSGEAKGMPEHFAEVARHIRETFPLPVGALVVDIGSNDGSLLRPFKDAGYRVLGIDPATAIARMATEAGIETIPELMSLDLARRIRAQYGPAHVVCMFNAFAHADNMGEIAEGIRTLLAPDGIFVFEAQYLLDIVDRVLIATIFHEHISHHSVLPLIPFLKRHGLQLIEVERAPIQHGSIIGTVQRAGAARRVGDSVGQLVELETRRQLGEVGTMLAFAAQIAALRAQTAKLAEKWRAGKTKVAGYGAARSGPTLVSQLGLDGVIDYIVDDHPQKVGRYSSGHGIPIVAVEELTKRMPEYTVILAWVHADKIITASREYLAKGGRFVVLCPKTRIVGAAGDIPITSLTA